MDVYTSLNILIKCHCFSFSADSEDKEGLRYSNKSYQGKMNQCIEQKPSKNQFVYSGLRSSRGESKYKCNNSINSCNS